MIWNCIEASLTLKLELLKWPEQSFWPLTLELYQIYIYFYIEAFIEVFKWSIQCVSSYFMVKKILKQMSMSIRIKWFIGWADKAPSNVTVSWPGTVASQLDKDGRHESWSQNIDQPLLAGISIGRNPWKLSSAGCVAGNSIPQLHCPITPALLLWSGTFWLHLCTVGWRYVSGPTQEIVWQHLGKQIVKI